MLNELIHSGQWFNRHLFHAGRRSVVWPTLSFGRSRLTAPVVIDTLSHCRQCGRHRQYECQRGI